MMFHIILIKRKSKENVDTKIIQIPRLSGFSNIKKLNFLEQLFTYIADMSLYINIHE